MDQDKGFIGTLYDFSFSQFVTPKVLKLLYTLGLLVALFGAIRFIGAGFDRGVLAGLVSLIVSPALFLLYSLLARVAVELAAELIRICEGVEEHRCHGQAEAPAEPEGEPEVVEAEPVDRPESTFE